jgi:Flp pilus assembly pilin Flp
MRNLHRRKSTERGQTLTEYVLIVVLVAVTALVVLRLFGAQIKGLFSKATSEIAQTTNSPAP